MAGKVWIYLNFGDLLSILDTSSGKGCEEKEIE